MTENNKTILKGKRGLIIGVANKMSLAYSIASFATMHGAELSFTYMNDILEKRVRPIAEELGSEHIYECNAVDDVSIKKAFTSIEKDFGQLDFIVHSVAFSDRNELKGRFLDTSLENFTNTMHVSCYSLVNIVRHAEHLLTNNSSILTLTYYGSQKVISNYNVMGVAKAALEASVRYLAADLGEKGIRVNALSAGPVKTLAASGIGDFNSMLHLHKSAAPLKRNTSQEDVAGAGVYLLSDLSSGVTGEVHYVDCGYNIMGMNYSIKEDEK
ncbi:MAG: enoyl-ACP reductase [Rickettsiaceae bacterium]|nr:enoyl-ACP reductase [Rickettsiaceae bacterium]